MKAFCDPTSAASSGERRRNHSFYRSDGAFELAELSAGTWKLIVLAESGSAEVEVALDEGQQLTDFTIELEPRVTIRGRAVDSRTGAAVSTVERLSKSALAKHVEETGELPPGTSLGEPSDRFYVR